MGLSRTLIGSYVDIVWLVQSARRINHRGDTLNNPTITLECSSPSPDVLLLKGYHWKAQVGSNAGPEYELFPDIDINELVINTSFLS